MTDEELDAILPLRYSRSKLLIQQTMTIDADEYNSLIAAIKAAKANERAAFRAGVEAAREESCQAMCEFCFKGDPVKYEAGDERNPSGWIHITRVGRAWCNAGGIRALPLPEMPE